MKYQQLIAQSKKHLEQNPSSINGVVSVNVFGLGAEWMFDRLNENETNSTISFSSGVNFFAYGTFKYGISLMVFLLSVYLIYPFSLWLLPISIVIFYIAEIHFLFLFPLLIDKVNRPLWTSIQQTYKTGLLTALINVIPIGFYMLIGLLNIKDPLRNWYIGCLSIIIWYKNEVRNRI